jgi:heat-inducible transcriptional repressor
MTTKPQLSPRQETILKTILDGYIATAVPVPSEVVTHRHGLGVSAATVRHEMAALEEEGYISRPHLSAGGVPTDKAYRYYVEALATTHELPLETKRSMQREFTSVGRDVDEWTKLSARMLAEVASNMALVSMPRTIQTRIRNLQLVYLDEHLVMQVVVLQEARLRKELVPLAEPVSEEDINHVAGKLNNHVKGLSYQEVLDRSIETTPLEKDVLDVALRILQEEDQASFADYIIEGLRHLVDQPEFKGSSQVHDLIEILESRRLAQAILTESPGVGGIRVVIGSENHEDALKPMSLVIAQYGVRNQVFGTISIVGPMRMHYERTIAGVNYFSSLMSQMLEEVGLGPS